MAEESEEQKQLLNEVQIEVMDIDKNQVPTAFLLADQTSLMEHCGDIRRKMFV